MTADVVIVEWSDLLLDADIPESESSGNGSGGARSIALESKSPSESHHQMTQALEKAYGATGTGILCIRGMPGFVEAKEAFLPLGHTLATKLPAGYLETHLTDESSLYNAGWSHGKEKLGEHKPPDTAKASFYYNPVSDTPGTEQDRQTYPLSYPCNVWPDDTLIPGFRDKAKTLGNLLKEACVAVAVHLDAFVASKQPTYTPSLITNSIKDTDKVKARLLYYFPLPERPSSSEATTPKSDSTTAPAEDSWIGWHNDSGFLTALAGDIYINHETGEQISPCPDPAAGLYVANRNVNVGGIETATSTSAVALHVVIPPDCVAVQVGECTQIVTGGAIQATPHCVRGCGSSSGRSDAAPSGLGDDEGMTVETPPSPSSSSSSSYPSIARISLPCFVDTGPTFRLQVPPGCTREQVLAADCSHNKVPPLAARWKDDDMTFGDFLQTTFAMYYNWNS